MRPGCVSISPVHSALRKLQASDRSSTYLKAPLQLFLPPAHTPTPTSSPGMATGVKKPLVVCGTNARQTGPLNPHCTGHSLQESSPS